MERLYPEIHPNWHRWAEEVNGDVVNIAVAFVVARRLMNENGLEAWGLEVSHAKVQGACMRYVCYMRDGRKFWNGKPGRIILSGPLMSLWTEEQQRRTILHEIAHCMCPDDGHGYVWQAYCRKLGIPAERCYGSMGEETIPRKPRQPAQFVWVGSCPGGHRHRRERKPSKTLACTACDPVPQERYVITWRKVARQ